MNCFLCTVNCLGQTRHNISVTPGVSHLVCPRCVALCKTRQELEHKVRDKVLELDLAGRGQKVIAGEKGEVPLPHELLPKKIAWGKPTDEQLANKFAHHTPFGDQAERYARIRAAALAFAVVVRDNTPTTPEQTRAFNEIHLAMMIANSAIALNEKPA